MIVLDVRLKHIYGFDEFHINFTYPKKVVDSLIGDEFLEGRERFRYKKTVILMGTNATGKTSLGKALLRIFDYTQTANEEKLREMADGDEAAEFQVDFVNEGFTLHRLKGTIKEEGIQIQYLTADIATMDSYEMAVAKFKDRTDEVAERPANLKKLIGQIHYRFAYPEIEHSLRLSDVRKNVLLKTLRAVVGTLDPTLTDVSVAKDLKDSFIIRRRGTEIIIQDGKLLNRDVLSSGTAEGIDVAVFLASMGCHDGSFYYCDEHFSYIQSDIEKRIFGLMLERLGQNEQLIFTTHNTDMLELNLPKHSFAFLKKQDEGGNYRVTVTFASDILKRNTDSVRCALENDVFGALPDDSLLDELEVIV